MAVWPPALPSMSDINKATYVETRKPNIIRTEMEVGPAQIRRRSTAVTTEFSGQMRMDRAQYDTFQIFFRDTIFDGALRFDATHPVTEAAVELRFLSPPDISMQGVGFILNLNLEILP